MNNKQETIADIVAEMRGFKRYAASDSRDCRYVAYWLYQTFADRIEAAHKREVESVAARCCSLGRLAGYGASEIKHQREVGNGAKMREALIDVVKRLEARVGCDHHTFHPTATTCDGITSVGKCGKIATCAAIFKARAALAESPRNCDRFKTLKDALAGWREVRPDESGPFDSWLFTAKKGETDGSK